MNDFAGSLGYLLPRVCCRLKLAIKPRTRRHVRTRGLGLEFIRRLETLK